MDGLSARMCRRRVQGRMQCAAFFTVVIVVLRFLRTVDVTVNMFVMALFRVRRVRMVWPVTGCKLMSMAMSIRMIMGMFMRMFMRVMMTMIMVTRSVEIMSMICGLCQ